MIPSRWGSSRFPGKPLHPLCGKPLLQHVCERVAQCQHLSGFAVATDDQRILDLCAQLGVRAITTSANHLTGTDRLAEAAQQFPEASHFINIQGDEPLIEPALIDQLATELQADANLEFITAASPLKDHTQLRDENIVKVVLSKNSDALYFSRAPIPFPRDPSGAPSFRHLGIYGYRADFLQKFVSWPPAPIELAESLEQLRALYHGTRIRVVQTDHEAIGLDSPDQIPFLERLLQQSSSS